MINLLHINITQTVWQMSMVLLLARATGACGKQLFSAVLVGKRSWPPIALGGISEYYSDWGVLALVHVSSADWVHSSLFAPSSVMEPVALPQNSFFASVQPSLTSSKFCLTLYVCLPVLSSLKEHYTWASYSSMQTHRSTSYWRCVFIHSSTSQTKDLSLCIFIHSYTLSRCLENIKSHI